MAPPRRRPGFGAVETEEIGGGGARGVAVVAPYDVDATATSSTASSTSESTWRPRRRRQRAMAMRWLRSYFRAVSCEAATAADEVCSNASRCAAEQRASTASMPVAV